MARLTHQSIVRKMLLLGAVPTVCAIVVVSAVSLLSTYVTARNNQLLDVESQAEVLAQNMAAALAFNDQRAADEMVGALKSRPNIELVCVYDLAGHIFSSYSRQQLRCPPSWPADTPQSSPFAVKPAAIGNQVTGTIFIRGNLATLTAWMQRQFYVVLFAFACGLLVAFALTYRLQREVSEPIVKLAGMLDRVSTTGDYSHRALRVTDDEIGHLVDAFNSMLDVIERHDHERNELLERAQESIRTKDEFLATMSHELRTPLNAMLGWLQIIRTTDVDRPMLERALASIERNAQSQARVVEDLLEVSRIATGKLQLRVGNLDFRSVVEAAIEVVRPAAAAKSVTISVRNAPAACPIIGDRDRLQQVIWNLLSNALKFTDSDGSIWVELMAEDRSYALHVRDSGIGIPREFLPYIFDRFRQADQSTTREHGGLGLGLAIAKELAELHGGSLRAASDGAGRGSVFTLRVPRQAAMSSLASGPQAPLELRLTGRRILVVDDDEDSLEIASRALATTGADVTAASSGGEALDRWRQSPFDILVCDLAMPHIDGFQVIRQVRALQNGGTPCLAVALTALASDRDREAALSAGFDRYLAKPFALPELLAQVVQLSPSAARS